MKKLPREETTIRVH